MSVLRCMIISPFDRDLDPVVAVVRDAVGRALPGEAIECIWLKEERSAGRITDDIVRGLQMAAFCVADVTGNNPNVMWEVGYAMALGKPTIMIGQCVEQLPFDLKDHRVHAYRREALGELAADLVGAVRQTLTRYDIKPARRAPASVPDRLTIAVTGSTRASRAKVHRRLDTYLQPFLGQKPLWLCGGIGDADEAAVDYLVGHGQQVLVLGYNRFDVSEILRPLVEDGRVGFLDTSVEACPRGLSGPTERDALITARADLVVLLWNGRSAGTGELLQYFQAHARGTLLAYVD